jgi:hypothetical protein
MRNNSGIATLDNDARLTAIGMVSDQDPLLNGALMAALAPTTTNGCVVNGCISELSSDAIHGVAHDYASAMKNYAVVYEQYQAYLMPRSELLPHDYELSVKLAVLTNPLGCLNEELFASTLSEDDVSDDDIEDCGYMGWLHH